MRLLVLLLLTGCSIDPPQPMHDWRDYDTTPLEIVEPLALPPEACPVGTQDCWLEEDGSFTLNNEAKLRLQARAVVLQANNELAQSHTQTLRLKEAEVHHLVESGKLGERLINAQANKQFDLENELYREKMMGIVRSIAQWAIAIGILAF